MPYIKTEWVDNETAITAKRLNKMEAGIELASSVLPDNDGAVGQVLTKTEDGTRWAEGGRPATVTGETLDLNGSSWSGGGDHGVAVEVDTTLSVSGAAADAKTVGDAIGDRSKLETTAKTDLVSAINEAAQRGGADITYDGDTMIVDKKGEGGSSECEAVDKVARKAIGNVASTADPVSDDYRYNKLLISETDVSPSEQYYSTVVENGELRKVINPSTSTFFNNGVNDVCAALTIADDYLKNWDQFYYDMSIGGKGGFVYNGTFDNPEEDAPALNQNGQKAMNCAIFTNLVLQGVPYTYSTYSKLTPTYKNLATNPVFAPKSKDAIAYGLENQYTYPNLSHHGLYTWKLARYLYDMGVLRPVGDNMIMNTGLGYQAEGTYNPGDILFFAQDGSVNDYFMGVRHCALLAGFIGYSTLKKNMLIIECSSVNSSPNISALKVRTLRDSDNIVAAFTPGYNNGLNLMAQPTTSFDEDNQAFSTNLVVERNNVACHGSDNAISVNSQFSGVFSHAKQYRGACVLVVDPIYTNSVAAVKWVITYHNTLDSWSDSILNGSGEHAMVGVGKFMIPIPYGTEVSLYTDSDYVSAANLKLNIVTSDKFLKV